MGHWRCRWRLRRQQRRWICAAILRTRRARLPQEAWGRQLGPCGSRGGGEEGYGNEEAGAHGTVGALEGREPQ
eukprot:1319811-Pyramimonas_sp.AAC.1